MESTAAHPKPKRRWLQFSLKGLFVFVLLVGAALGWAVHEARKQRIAVAALEKAGCEVHLFDGQPPTALKWIRMLVGEDELMDVGRVFAGSRLTDAEMVYLEDMTHLSCLLLDKTQVTDAGLIHLHGQTRLSYLYLDDTQVTDAGMTHLARLTHLSHLRLNGAKVTDAGLVHLQGLKQLRFHDLTGTRVTDAGVLEFQKALPKCRVRTE